MQKIRHDSFEGDQGQQQVLDWMIAIYIKYI